MTIFYVIFIIHTLQFAVVFSNKIYAPVSFKIVLKILVKREYGLKMCTVKM